MKNIKMTRDSRLQRSGDTCNRIGEIFQDESRKQDNGK